VRDQGRGHGDHGAALKSQYRDNDTGKRNDGDDQPLVQPLPDPGFRIVRCDEPVLPGRIQPLECENEAKDHQVELEETGGNYISIIIADKTGGERDKGDKKKLIMLKYRKLLSIWWTFANCS